METAVVMLEEGCPLDIVTSAGATLQHYAAAGGNVELMSKGGGTGGGRGGTRPPKNL